MLNKRLMVSVFVLGLWIATGSWAVFAETPSKEMYVSVSFQFVVGEQLFMPGDYQVSLINHGRSIKVTTWDGVSRVEVPVITSIPRAQHTDHVTMESLVFYKVGSNVGFLSEVWLQEGNGYLVMKKPGIQTILAANPKQKSLL